MEYPCDKVTIEWSSQNGDAHTSRSAREPTPGVTDGYVGFGMMAVPFTCVEVGQQQARATR